jgi:HlyD family secretion protein
MLRPSSAAPTRDYNLIFPRRLPITATVNATGQIEPMQTVNLSFTTPGRVSEVLVDLGQMVQAGTPLARLDPRELTIRLAQADAQLRQAQANQQKLLAGASAADIAIAEAQVRQAQSQLRQTTGSVTNADLAAAAAQLEQAQTQLAVAEAGPDPTQVTLAEQQLAQAEAQLESQRDQLSAAKTNAEIQLEQSANSLTQAQSRYATAKMNWEFIEATGNDPINPTIRVGDLENSIILPNKLSETQRRQYYDTFVQAEAQLQIAENNVSQAIVQLESARQAEINGIRLNEQQVAQAVTRLQQAQSGATLDQLAAARAQVASAQANLNRLRGDQRSGALGVAQAGLEQSRARLDQLQANPGASDLELSAAQVASAQATRDLAQLAVDDSTLRAPITGTVAELNLRVGEVAPARAIVLADLSQFKITIRVDEIDIPRINTAQPVTLTLDALPNVALTGQVESVAPLAAAQAAVTSYEVRISARTNDPRVRAGMSASADITVARKEDALLVPRRAVRNDRGELVVDVVADSAQCTNVATTNAAPPALEQRVVRTGLSNELLIEILEGLSAQDCVYVEGIDARLRGFLGGPPPGTRQQR